MLTRDNVMSLGSYQSVLPRDDLKFADLCSLPNCIDAFKSKYEHGNFSSDKNFRNLKDLPNGNLKHSLRPALENITSAEDYIKSMSVESVVERVLNSSVL